ncbi:MAG: hypothetical protein V7K68_06830 [Nostoc sp.]|uniref:hypothetical protein n=1 Tax=Nostoc sp. TaxID=1180 RepID=UPI002FF627ED
MKKDKNIFSLPVVLRLVYRQISGIREVGWILSSEGLLWVGCIEVSTQAISKKFQTLLSRIIYKNL